MNIGLIKKSTIDFLSNGFFKIASDSTIVWRLLLILLLSGCVQTGQVVNTINENGNFSNISFNNSAESAALGPTPMDTIQKETDAVPIITPIQPPPTITPTPTDAVATPTTTPEKISTPTPTPTPCVAEWHCTGWSACENSKQSRNCTDVNACAGAKAEQQDCISLNHVVFAEIFYDTPGNDNIEEWVKLYNPGNSLEIVNWSISDNAGEWHFSASAPAKTYLTIARNSGGFKNLTGCDADISGFTRGLNNDGDYLVLRDTSGNEIDSVAWENGYEKSHQSWNVTAAMGKSIWRVSLSTDTNSVNDWIAGDAHPCP